ncbi:putative manganese-dependent inorganic diphosphatase [bacterium 210820-DFI.6.37]|nr:putative manganese-dependent inorganic diphosphatase [bacterium 210820-DFI.6.37]
MNKQPIYVIGHKNPDTDSIVSAIAYADIKSRTGEGRYIAARAGQINEETEYVLKRFDMEPPLYLSNVGTQVKDMEIRRTPGVSREISIRSAWQIMKESEAVTLPVTTKEGLLEGIVTTGDIAKSYMDVHDSLFLSRAGTRFKSIAETVGGKILVGDGNQVFSKGKVIVGAAHPDRMETYLEPGDLILMGDRYEDHLRAVEQGAGCVIVCVNAKVGYSIKRIAEKKGCVLISTPYDTFTVARLINQSIPLSHIMKRDGLLTFKTDDYTDEIKEVMSSTRHRAFPVLDKNNVYIGTISRRNFLGMQKKQLILVDHNEKSQAADNIENAQVLEIIDHHRLGSLETIEPVFFRNQPEGCTATILHQIYQERQLEIPEKIAGLLCAAILSDTLMFRSPTCTERDRRAAAQLAEIAGIQMEEFAAEMFRAGSNLSDKSTEEIFFQDFKKFIAGEESFGVGQISSLDKEELDLLQKRLLPFMEAQCGKNGMTKIFYMLTDILEENTRLICCGEGSAALAEEAFQVRETQGYFLLEGVVSRKKQLIPAFMSALQENEQSL